MENGIVVLANMLKERENPTITVGKRATVVETVPEIKIAFSKEILLTSNNLQFTQRTKNIEYKVGDEVLLLCGDSPTLYYVIDIF